MLYLNPPYFVIDGISVFPDESDPLQFYYLPMMPHFTMEIDSATNKQTPQLQLIEYEGAAGTGGFINFDVNLGIDDPNKLDEVGNQIQRQLNLARRMRPDRKDRYRRTSGILLARSTFLSRNVQPVTE